MNISNLLFLIIFGFAASANIIDKNELVPLKPSEQYTHSLVADEDDENLYRLFWKLLGDKQDEIQFEIHCKSLGWVGLGFSPNGDMQGDFAIGWVKDGIVFLKDAHSEPKTKPKIDKIQDWNLISGKEADGYTVLKMKRKLNTCDKEQDLEIKKETNYLLLAWNDKDPETGNEDWLYHGRSNRRVQVADLLGYKDETIDQVNADAEQAITVDYTLNNHLIKGQSTYYYCQFFEVPDFESDVHLIRYDMLVDKRNKDMVHHLLIYECDRDILQKPVYGSECGYVQVAEDMGRCLSTTLIAAWGVGGKKDFSFPANTGYPVFKNEKKKLLIFEFHYDNPRMETNRFDSSGIRFFYTKKLRENELGIFQLTSPTTYMSTQIPDKVDNLKLTSTCYPECTNKIFPDDGINVFSGFLHTHLAGRAVRTLLVRNDKVIANLFDNPKYDFNYQYNLDIKPTKLYKGDALILECEYNTMDRDNFTTWGFGTRDEMCMNFMFYYPRVKKLTTCQSMGSFQSFYNFYKSLKNNIPGIDSVLNFEYGFYNFIFNIDRILEFLKSVKLDDQTKKMFVDFYKNPGKSYAFCGYEYDYDFGENTPEKDFYVPKEYLKEPEDICKQKPSNSSKKLSNNFALLSFVFLTIFMKIIF